MRNADYTPVAQIPMVDLGAQYEAAKARREEAELRKLEYLNQFKKVRGPLAEGVRPEVDKLWQEIEKVLEAEWSMARTYEARRRIAEMGTWFIVGFCSGLHGEEMLIIDLAGTAASLIFHTDRVCPHFMLTISGRTKGSQLSGTKFSVPIAWTTEYLGLKPGQWVTATV